MLTHMPDVIGYNMLSSSYKGTNKKGKSKRIVKDFSFAFPKGHSLGETKVAFYFQHILIFLYRDRFPASLVTR